VKIPITACLPTKNFSGSVGSCRLTPHGADAVLIIWGIYKNCKWIRRIYANDGKQLLEIFNLYLRSVAGLKKLHFFCFSPQVGDFALTPPGIEVKLLLPLLPEKASYSTKQAGCFRLYKKF